MKHERKGKWLYIVNEAATKNRVDIAENIYITAGKYLFFSDSKLKLIELAKTILKEYELFAAKVPANNTPNKSRDFGFVLCVYDYKDRYSHELKKFESGSIYYEYWKSDNETRNESIKH